MCIFNMNIQDCADSFLHNDQVCVVKPEMKYF